MHGRQSECSTNWGGYFKIILFVFNFNVSDRGYPGKSREKGEIWRHSEASDGGIFIFYKVSDFKNIRFLDLRKILR